VSDLNKNDQAIIGKAIIVTPPPETPDETFKRLAKLSIADYERERTIEAKKLGNGYRVSTLDKGVEAAIIISISGFCLRTICAASRRFPALNATATGCPVCS